jgi:hypothetical protein
MQALSGANEPSPEAVLWPVRRSQQNDPGSLHEEHAQVTVAGLGYPSEDGSISGRHLLRDEAKPSRKISSFRECRAIADRRNDRARDDWADARYGQVIFRSAFTSLASSGGRVRSHWFGEARLWSTNQALEPTP